MKRVLFVLAAAILLINTTVVPTVARADGGAGSTSCNGKMCKPVSFAPPVMALADGGAGSTSCPNGKMCKP